jgi:hypothetical protein
MTGRSASGARGRRRWHVALPWVLAGLATFGGSWLTPVAAAELCIVEIDGQSLAAADDPSRAIAIPADGDVTVVGQSALPVSHTAVTISVWPLSWTTVTDPPAPTTEWTGTLPVSQYSQLGTGLYQIVATADVCEVRGWVNVTGASIFGSPLAVVGLGLAIIGVLIAIRSVLFARRRRGGPLPAIAGGALTGIGLLLLAQQSGQSAVTPDSVVLWVALPGAIGGLAHLVAGSFGGAGTGAAAPAPGSPTSPPGPPPPTPGPPPPAPLPSAPSPAPPPPSASVRPPSPAAVPAATPGTVAGPVSHEPDPPRSAYARLSCPDAVVVAQPFEVIVGLAEQPNARVVGEALRRPESSVGPYTMTIQLVADGLQLAGPDASWRIDLPVTAEAPYPSTTIHLVPDAQAEPILATSIRAMYSIDGNPIGLAVRSVAVVRSAELLATAPTQPSSPGVDLSLPAGQVAPDLTVRIERAGSGSGGQLLVQLLAADPTIDTPDAPMRIDVGEDPASDLRRIVDEVSKVEGRPTQYAALRGIGLTIADRLPGEFWDVLARIAARVHGRPPSILFLSAEPYVPWELAVVDPPLDPGLPPFLGAQATVGRWLLGQRRPPLPPPMAVAVSHFAAVSGVYTLPGWQRLFDAEAEAADIVRIYHADAVDATAVGILDLLRGHPAADVIHFAVHGTYDADVDKEGLILVDGTALDPLAIRGTPLRGRPFVFLNACQVGRGNQLLGDQSGLAEAFLAAGASGVIAPLWSIDDTLAREIATRFYERAMRGDAPAEIMRTERAAFRDTPETTSSTYLAYQFFGHPGLHLEAPDT